MEEMLPASQDCFFCPKKTYPVDSVSWVYSSGLDQSNLYEFQWKNQHRIDSMEEIRRSPVEVGSEHPIIYEGFMHPTWCRIFFHQRWIMKIFEKGPLPKIVQEEN